MNPIRYRHAYLHSATAGETEHVVAAALELRAHKTKQDVQAGHLFVDSRQALHTTRNILYSEMGKLQGRRSMAELRQNTRDFAKYQDLSHAARHLVDLSDQNANPQLTSSQDKLYVKGHGSPNVNRGITAQARTLQVGANRTFVKESLSVRHQMRDVAEGVGHVADKLGQRALQVRLTSCGSAGGYEYHTDDDTIRETQRPSAATRLKQELLRHGGAHDFEVMGYRGSANSTNPTRIPDEPGRHFMTKVKFPNLDHTNPQQYPRQAFTDVFGTGVRVDYGKQKLVSEEMTARVPVNPGMSEKIATLNQVRGPNPDNTIKRTLYTEQRQGLQVSMRRSKARVKV